ncbi:MAG: helix-turn-helix transcriptional regulator [Telluria sp.]
MATNLITIAPLPRRVVRHNTLPEITGLSESTIRRMIRAGEFPAPFRLSNQAVGFDSQEVFAWLEARKATRSEVPA